MALFKRSQRGILPPNVIPLMERYGRFEIAPRQSHEDSSSLFQDTQQPFLVAATNDPEGFIKALADVCIPVGGWAVYGADRTVVNLIGVSPPGEDWPRILDASLAFLRSNYVPPMRVAQYAWMRYIDSGGSANTWLDLRSPPNRLTAVITPLNDGEVRRLAKLDAAPDANVVLVRREGEEFVVLVEARWSDDDPTRSQSEWKRADDLYDLYLDIAWSFQARDWNDAELEPFFPAPKALI